MSYTACRVTLFVILAAVPAGVMSTFCMYIYLREIWAEEIAHDREVGLK